jgi:hypothetical protein
MLGAKTRGDVCYFERRRNPVQVWIRAQQRVKSIDALPVRIAVRLYEEFHHRDGRCHRGMTRPIQPFEYRVGKRDVSRVGLYLVDEDARIERDSAVTLQETSKFG